MDESLEFDRPYNVKSKRNVVLAVFAIQAASAIGEWIAAGYSEQAMRVVWILGSVAIVAAVIVWCHTDASERGIKLGNGFRAFAVLLLPAAVIYYLLRSRGTRRGLVSILKVTGLFLLSMLLSAIIDVCLALVDDRLGLFRE